MAAIAVWEARRLRKLQQALVLIKEARTALVTFKRGSHALREKVMEARLG